MRNHSFEVPFIANYRKEYVEPELDIHDLWAIWQSDEKVCAYIIVCVCASIQCTHSIYVHVLHVCVILSSKVRTLYHVIFSVNYYCDTLFIVNYITIFSYAWIHIHIHVLFIFLTHSLTLTLSHSHTNTLSHSHTHTLSLSLSHSLTHSLTVDAVEAEEGSDSAVVSEAAGLPV